MIGEKGGFISELAILHHLVAVRRGRGLIHSRFYRSERGQRPGPTAKKRFQKGVGQAIARVSPRPYLFPQVLLVNESPKSDQKDLKGRKNSRSHSQRFVRVYTSYTYPGLFTLSRSIPTYPLRSSDSRSFAAIPQMNLPRKRPSSCLDMNLRPSPTEL